MDFIEIWKAALSNELATRININDVFATFLVTVAFIIVYVFLTLWLTKAIRWIVIRKFLRKKMTARGDTLARMTAGAINTILWFALLMVALEDLGINITPILASAGILGLAVGFGAQNLVRDCVAGFFIIMHDAFHVGDTVEIGGFRGTVKSMNLRVTHIRNFMGAELIINNGSVSQITNWSRNNNLAVVDFGVDYATNLSKVAAIMPDFVAKLSAEIEEILEPATFLGVTSLADSSINMRIIAPTKIGSQWGVERKIRHALVEFLNENNVSIPFPQVVVHQAKSKT
ncbi:MAG: mechanosensitive ion channel family protein [Acholeplasmatales bacterium]|nr:MAG: mechanosensitive ion channel family protein [Acholeplasmatales bacterium]